MSESLFSFNKNKWKKNGLVSVSGNLKKWFSLKKKDDVKTTDPRWAIVVVFLNCVGLLACNANVIFLHYFVFPEKMAPQLQAGAPSFAGTAVVNGQFKDIHINDYKGKYLILFFYPLDL